MQTSEYLCSGVLGLRVEGVGLRAWDQGSGGSMAVSGMEGLGVQVLLPCMYPLCTSSTG